MDLFVQRNRFSFHEGYSDGDPYRAFYRARRAEVSIILEGAISFVEDGRPRTVEAPALTCQTYERELEVVPAAGRRTRTMWCHFPPHRLSAADWSFLRGLPPTMPVVDSLRAMFRGAAPLLQSIDEARTDLVGVETSSDGRAMVRDALGAAIFAEYIRCASEVGDARKTLPQAVREVQSAIDERYGETWDLDRLATVAQLNPKYLIAMFRRHLDETPIAYLWRKRAESGYSMLRQTRLSVEEIAFRCGYQTVAHFSRTIKQRYGAPPRDIRAETSPGG
ncbi:AraC family transcriptional regulator [Sphingobium sp.]|uniref:AraC family transcriptional regulator n=1 Tax=Sphingobium sp. TaxID=1912891 RepID=UPI002C62068E|nr:AraC family transcriptional regulator [Sphingobium sp.]HUD90294.1 AraC family transcriptional regulator [Sphingobium sp.]